MKKQKKEEKREISPEDFTRIANNFYNSNGLQSDYNRIIIDSQLFNYFNQNINLPKYKIAFCWICLNPPYWQYAKEMIEGAKKFFLPGHQVDYFLWSDMPQEQSYGATVFSTESVEWPMPTLMRYSLFLQQEEVLKDYDYIFYCDVDMKFVGVVGDEILGKGLTAALHPGYALRKEYWPPYEPNKQSAAYINRPGLVINDEGKKRFMPMYFAGGFQGGVAKEYLKACKEMKRMVDKDLGMNYIPIWNDESIFNKYLERTPEDLIVLTPSYIYPDSLIKEYYEPLWGCSYVPKLMTLTKPFSVSKEGGEAVKKMLGL